MSTVSINNTVPRHRPAPKRAPFFSPAGIILALAIVGFCAIQLCAIHAPFAPLDDTNELRFVRLSAWPQLFATDTFTLFRPIKNLFFFIGDALIRAGGLPAFRCLAILIGILALLAVYRLCRHIFPSPIPAAVATGLWALAPTLVSMTAWLSCINIQLMTACTVLAVVYHDDAAAAPDRRKTIRHATNACLLLALALLSYESAVAFVGLVFLFDAFLRPGRLCQKRTWILYAAYIAVTCIYLILRFYLQASTAVNGSFLPGTTRFQVIAAAAWFVWQHFGAWFWPFGHMAIIGGYATGTVPLVALVAAWCGLLLVGGLILAGRKAAPILTFGLAWAFCAFAPTSNILGFKNGPYGDYYLTVASVGFAVGIASLLAKAWGTTTRQRCVAALATATALVVWRGAAAVEAIRWARIWNDPLCVLTTTINTFPEAFDAEVFLSEQLINAHQDAAARQLLEDVMRRVPTLYTPLRGLAILAQHAGQPNEALRHLDVLFAWDPKNTWVWYFKGYILETDLHDPMGAETCYRHALGLHRDDNTPQILRQLAGLLAAQGRFPEAINNWQRSLQGDPDSPETHHNLAVAYTRLGQPALAAQHQARALALYRMSRFVEDPDNHRP